MRFLPNGGVIRIRDGRKMARGIQMLAASYGNQGSRRDEERREITMCLNSRLFARVSLDFTLDGRISSRAD